MLLSLCPTKCGRKCGELNLWANLDYMKSSFKHIQEWSTIIRKNLTFENWETKLRTLKMATEYESIEMLI